jgi:hypothetical protein
MEAKRKRTPSPPRQAQLKRPMTAAALKTQMGSLAIMPPKTVPKDNFPIEMPSIKPDMQIAHEQMLDQA